MNVCPTVLYAFLNGWTDFDKICCVCLSGSREDFYSQLDLIGPSRGGARTGILQIFMMGIFVYKWLLLVKREIISRNRYLLFYWLPLVNHVSNRIFKHFLSRWPRCTYSLSSALSAIRDVVGLPTRVTELHLLTQ